MYADSHGYDGVFVVQWNHGPFFSGSNGCFVSGYAKFVDGVFMLASMICAFCPWYAGQRVSVSNGVVFDDRFLPVIDVVGHVNDWLLICIS